MPGAGAFQELLCNRRAPHSDRLSKPLLQTRGLGPVLSTPTSSMPPLMEAVFPFFEASDLCALCATSSGMREMMEEPSASNVLMEWAKEKAWFGEFRCQAEKTPKRQPERSPDDDEERALRSHSSLPPTSAALRGFITMRGRRLQAEAVAKQRRVLLAKWLGPFTLTIAMTLFVGLGSKYADDAGIHQPPMAVVVLFAFVGSLMASLMHIYTAAYHDPVATGTAVAVATFILSNVDNAYCCSAWQEGSLRVYGCLHLIAAGFGVLGWLTHDAAQGKDKHRPHSLPPLFRDHRLR